MFHKRKSSFFIYLGIFCYKSTMSTRIGICVGSFPFILAGDEARQFSEAFGKGEQQASLKIF